VIIAIDGPAGSGKSSTAKAVAERLGFLHLDSGAWYRALTLAAVAAGIPESDWERFGEEDVEALRVEGAFRDGALAMSVRGRPIEDDALRREEVTSRVSVMARVPAVRGWLLERQRELAAACDVVVDGRDIGTVVFPDAELKIYLEARPHVRAERRLLQRGREDAGPVDITQETARLEARDRQDSGRAIAPLRRAEDAVLLDTSDLSFEEQVAAIVALVAGRGGEAPG
jgi:cytidylate kinase